MQNRNGLEEKKRPESLVKENLQSLKGFNRIADALSQIKMQASTKKLSHIKNFYLDVNEETHRPLKSYCQEVTQSIASLKLRSPLVRQLALMMRVFYSWIGRFDKQFLQVF